MADYLDAAIRFGRNESGQDLAEYALLSGVLSLAAISAIGTFAGHVVTAVSTVSHSFTAAL